jgi:hypothetical protein
MIKTLALSQNKPDDGNVSMKCDRCKKDTYSVYITENYERLCSSCCDKEDQKKKKRNEVQPLKETRSY